MSRKPDFVVIGAQKSASTFIQFCLTDHPEIWMPWGETSYFEDPDYNDAPPDAFERLFAGRSEPVLGIKRPQYIGRAEVPERLCFDLPEARLIAVLRNPVDRALSAYYHYIRSGFLPVLPPEDGLAQLLDGRGIHDTCPRAWEVLEFGRYHRHLLGYKRYIDAARLKILLHEDIEADAIGSAQEIYSFLGVDPKFVPVRATSRPQAVVYDATRLRLLRSVSLATIHYNEDGTRSNGYRGYLAKVGFNTWRMVDEVLLARLTKNTKPRLAAELRQRLTEFYNEDNDRLSRLIDRDLSAWQSAR